MTTCEDRNYECCNLNPLPMPYTEADYASHVLEYLRSQIRAERISYREISELQGMADQIDRGDVELLEWAGVPEFPEDSFTAKEL